MLRNSLETALGEMVTRRAMNIWLAGLTASGLIPSYGANASTKRLLAYKAAHSLYGDIGTYSNDIEEDNETTVIRTLVRLSVRVLRIVLYRENADRIEIWREGRLQAFHGETITNGNSVLITGKAQDDSFIVTSPYGTAVAPARVTPSNPWSGAFLKSDTMMLSDSGIIQSVRVSQPTIVSIIVNRLPMRAREYRIDATPSYKVWVNEGDVPVMFAVYDESGLVTFTLSDGT